MIYAYVCKDKVCAEKESAVFRLEIPSEAVMDDKNIATIFCHKCGTELMIEQIPKNEEKE
jgi:hypothetical protein